jgi:hypothetical protein
MAPQVLPSSLQSRFIDQKSSHVCIVSLHHYLVADPSFIDLLLNPVLDDLSVWLKADELFGCAVLFSLIFITTIRQSDSLSVFVFLAHAQD